MQTFLPYPDFRKSAECLDFRRLGKQRVECMQLLRTLRGKSTGWQNHPACKMWKGYENSLILYGWIICEEWIKRGYRDSCVEKIKSFDDPREGLTYPKWLGNEQFHASHRSNLLRKLPAWYGVFGWQEPDNLPYMWPI